MTNKTSRICAAPDCGLAISPYMPFCALHMQNDWHNAVSA